MTRRTSGSTGEFLIPWWIRRWLMPVSRFCEFPHGSPIHPFGFRSRCRICFEQASRSQVFAVGPAQQSARYGARLAIFAFPRTGLANPTRETTARRIGGGTAREPRRRRCHLPGRCPQFPGMHRKGCLNHLRRGGMVSHRHEPVSRSGLAKMASPPGSSFSLQRTYEPEWREPVSGLVTSDQVAARHTASAYERAAHPGRRHCRHDHGQQTAPSRSLTRAGTRCCGCTAG